MGIASVSLLCETHLVTAKQEQTYPKKEADDKPWTFDMRVSPQKWFLGLRQGGGGTRRYPRKTPGQDRLFLNSREIR